jgi:hypothetical protein
MLRVGPDRAGPGLAWTYMATVCREHAFHFPKCPFVVNPAETDNIPILADGESAAAASTASASVSTAAGGSAEAPASPPPLASHGTAVWPAAVGSGLSSLVLQVQNQRVDN